MFGVIMSEAPGGTDRLFAGLALRLIARGLRVRGAVQENVTLPRPGPCAMDLHILGTARVIRISQDLGPAAQGCRMDSGALEAVVGHVTATLAGGCDLLLVNKFGKAEGEGRGFRALIAAALADGCPVLTAVRPANRAAFDAFAAGMATPLAADPDALDAWVAGVCRTPAAG